MEVKKNQMFLPDDVIGLIREFSRPIGLRLDWRKCKRNESRRIKGSNLGILRWYQWFIGNNTPELCQEIESWTFYGRRKLLQQSRIRFWSQEVIPELPQEEDPEWYEKLYLIHNTMPQMITQNAVEWHMRKVSLIV
jgi:hypothetical protein